MAKPLPLSLLLENLSRHLVQTPAHLRNVTGTMLSTLALHPENHETAVRVLTVLMTAPASKPEPDAKVKHLRMVQKGGTA